MPLRTLTMYAGSELRDKWQVLKLFVCERLDVNTVPDAHTQEILFSTHDITNKCAVELTSRFIATHATQEL